MNKGQFEKFTEIADKLYAIKLTYGIEILKLATSIYNASEKMETQKAIMEYDTDQWSQ